MILYSHDSSDLYIYDNEILSSPIYLSQWNLTLSIKYIYKYIKDMCHAICACLISKLRTEVWVWFDGISNIVGYLMPNPGYKYILNIYMICKYI